MTIEEASMKKKDRKVSWDSDPFYNVSQRLTAKLTQLVGLDARYVIPGHVQRGGNPCAYDRILSTEFGVKAAQLIRSKTYGVTVALKGDTVTHNLLEDIAGKAKPVPMDNQILQTAKAMGICLG